MSVVSVLTDTFHTIYVNFILLCNSDNACDIITIDENAFSHAYKNNFVSLKVKMTTQKLTVEISESNK